MLNLNFIEMYLLMQNKNKHNSNSQSVKKQKSKPEWTTDFVDRQQYKLSEVERIQKKASLQSKNRQQARRQLQQRRKKLSLGIIDEQTKKIYQTALISKNIDINPPFRRNLTEMIKYQKQQRQKTIEEHQAYNGEDNEEDFDDQALQKQQLRDAQNFIKKFQKAKKQQKIERAVEILSNNQSIGNQQKAIQLKNPETKTNNFLRNLHQSEWGSNKSVSHDFKRSNKSEIQSQDQAISSIEDTIRFMEEKLFLAKRTVDEHSKSFISDSNQSLENENYTNFDMRDKQTGSAPMSNFIKKGKFNTKMMDAKSQLENNELSQQYEEFGNNIGQISQLKINFKDADGAQSDEECLQTIRRMRQLLQSHQTQQESHNNRRTSQNIKSYNIKGNFVSSNLANSEFNSIISKKSLQSGLDSEAEVSFNLTANDDQLQQQISRLNKNQINYKQSNINSNRNQSFQQFVIKDANTKNSTIQKQEEYENQYKNVKQNLFSYINQDNQRLFSRNNKKQIINNIKLSSEILNPDSGESQNSEDSLLVQNKINIWKKQFEHQVDPQDDEEKERTQDFKIKESKFKNKNTLLLYDCTRKQAEQEQENEELYNNNFVSKGIHESGSYSIMNLKQGYKQQKQNDDNVNKLAIRKPPLAKKSQNDERFQDIKRMISKASTEVQELKIQPLKIQSLGTKEVMGFDFRGSINIKKNIK